MSSPNTPIVNAGILYVNGLEILKSGNQTITLKAGFCRDSTNTNDITIASTTVSGENVGVVNGIDTAAFVADTFYAVYAIADSQGYNVSGGYFSTNYNANQTPNLPHGYDMYRRIGFVRTDGSANIYAFWQYGTDQKRTYYYDVSQSVLSGGASTTYDTVNLNSWVPSVVSNYGVNAFFVPQEVLLKVQFTPAAATDIVSIIPYGSLATAGVVVFGTGVAAAQTGMLTVPVQNNSNVPAIQYKVTAGGDSLTLLVAGYTDYIV